jgi:hypothetical protein
MVRSYLKRVGIGGLYHTSMALSVVACDPLVKPMDRLGMSSSFIFRLPSGIVKAPIRYNIPETTLPP